MEIKSYEDYLKFIYELERQIEEDIENESESN